MKGKDEEENVNGSIPNNNYPYNLHTEDSGSNESEEKGRHAPLTTSADDKWGSLRELVKGNEPPACDSFRNERHKSHSQLVQWSVELPYQFSLWECLLISLALLSMGVIAFSLIFENWSIHDSLYFTTVLLTTVGYGDLSPSTIGGKLFASVYGIAGVMLISLALGVLGSQMVEAELNSVEETKSKVATTMEHAFTEQSSRCLTLNLQSPSYEMEPIEFCSSEAKSPLRNLFWIMPLLIGTCVISSYEDWPWYDAIYFTSVTATTIGFGDLSPGKTSTRYVAIIFIPLSVATMGYVLGKLASYIVERRMDAHHRKLCAFEFTEDDLDALDANDDGEVSELEYVRFMLIAMKKVDAKLIDKLQSQFQDLDVTRDGKINRKDLEVLARKKRMGALKRLESVDVCNALNFSICPGVT